MANRGKRSNRRWCILFQKTRSMPVPNAMAGFPRCERRWASTEQPIEGLISGQGMSPEFVRTGLVQGRSFSVFQSRGRLRHRRLRGPRNWGQGQWADGSPWIARGAGYGAFRWWLPLAEAVRLLGG